MGGDLGSAVVEVHARAARGFRFTTAQRHTSAASAVDDLFYLSQPGAGW